VIGEFESCTAFPRPARIIHRDPGPRQPVRDFIQNFIQTLAAWPNGDAAPLQCLNIGKLSASGAQPVQISSAGRIFFLPNSHPYVYFAV